MITLYVLFCFCIYQINEQVITLLISGYNKNRPGITICYCGITVTMYYHNQGIGLGYHITNESYSIVHQLYNTKKLLINNSLFII